MRRQEASSEMPKFLTISQAARRLGASADAVRDWVEQGKLRAELTPGGHRRVLSADVEKLAGAKDPTRTASPTSMPPNVGFRAAPRMPLFCDDRGTVWQNIARDARAKLEAVKARSETSSILGEREAQETRARVEAEKVANEAKEAKRLEALKTLGREEAVAAGLPPAWRARVSADLESYVNATQFPPTLPAHEARDFIRAKVGECVNQFREEAAVKQERESAAQAAVLERITVNNLLEWGLSHAAERTGLWDSRDRVRALAEVQRGLRDEVEADWSYEEVRILVEDLLEGDEDDADFDDDDEVEEDEVEGLDDEDDLDEDLDEA